jgi:hypothetical protein
MVAETVNAGQLVNAVVAMLTPHTNYNRPGKAQCRARAGLNPTKMQKNQLVPAGSPFSTDEEFKVRSRTADLWGYGALR